MIMKKHGTKKVFCTESEILSQVSLRKLRNLLILGQTAIKSKTDSEKIAAAIENQSIPDYLKCDPDFIRFTGFNNGYEEIKRLPFEEITIGNTCYIYTNDFENELTQLAKDMLTQFFSSKYKNYFESTEANTWEAFEKEENCIAYRGGAGYTYGIWRYTATNYIEVNKKKVYVFDNGGETYDRYTILLSNSDVYGCNESPFAPTGFAQFSFNNADNYMFHSYGASWRKHFDVKKLEKQYFEQYLSDNKEDSTIGKLIDPRSLNKDVLQYINQIAKD